MLSQRRFGVEIECGHPQGSDHVRRLLRKEGLNPLGVGYDGSGVEIQSPILKGSSGFAWLKEAFECLRKDGAYVGQPDGMHVHHEGNPGYHSGFKRTITDGGYPQQTTRLNMVGCLRLIRSWSNNNDHIEKLVNEYRRANTSYCNKVWKGSGSRRLIKSAEKGDFPGKYSDLNMRSLHSSKGTIEIRLHEGTLDFEEAEAWIRFCQSLLDHTAARARPLPDQKSIEGLLKVLELPATIEKRLLAKAKRNGTPAPNSAFDPSVEDDDDPF